MVGEPLGERLDLAEKQIVDGVDNGPAGDPPRGKGRPGTPWRVGMEQVVACRLHELGNRPYCPAIPRMP